jgi:hypothetical protein
LKLALEASMLSNHPAGFAIMCALISANTYGFREMSKVFFLGLTYRTERRRHMSKRKSHEIDEKKITNLSSIWVTNDDSRT